MEIHTNIPLKNMTTMRLGGPARFFADARTPEEVQALVQNAREKNIPVFILGGGSNIVARDEGFNGLVIRIRIPGFETVADDVSSTTFKVGAGEIWDDIVQKSVDLRLSGIETMSAIPGTAGAAPVQNVGAYGQEIAETLVSLEAYDIETDSFVTLQNAECGFSYRHSIFRGEAWGRYIITSITLKLYKSFPAPPFYESLQGYLDEHHISVYTHEAIRGAVVAIRADKLPDPKLVANSGSFFKNTIVEDWKMNEIRTEFPDVKAYEMGNGIFKIPTGWMIEHAGLKGKVFANGMRINDKNALVLINDSAKSYADLAAARDEIIDIVRDKYHVVIEQEPLELPI